MSTVLLLRVRGHVRNAAHAEGECTVSEDAPPSRDAISTTAAGPLALREPRWFKEFVTNEAVDNFSGAQARATAFASVHGLLIHMMKTITSSSTTRL
mmetsp:Transcript_20906/g.60388  ORF Transcript_20906/g.60388 Transcript_20906/m.60388 type:complete len:97 (+) Transcript_20906:79-369(+)